MPLPEGGGMSLGPDLDEHRRCFIGNMRGMYKDNDSRSSRGLRADLGTTEHKVRPLAVRYSSDSLPLDNTIRTP